MTKQYTFTDRSSYFVARQEWREDYKELTQKSRAYKAEKRANLQASREAKAIGEGAKFLDEAMKAHHNHKHIRVLARAMMKTREAMKKEAQRQYTAERVSSGTQTSVTV